MPGGSETIYDFDRRVSKRTQILPPLPEDKFLCSFSHIFAGGYAAGYYSYKVFGYKKLLPDWFLHLSYRIFIIGRKTVIVDNFQIYEVGRGVVC